MRYVPIIAGAVVSIGGLLSGVAAYEFALPQTGHWQEIARWQEIPHWQEITWPFPRDGWPAGRAFRCEAVSCGAEVELYVRPKIGFCNCDSGVADDDEVDRVADLDLISERFAPLAPGRAVRIAEMSGRLRSYRLDMPDGARRAAVGIALSHRCDLLVAVAQGAGDAPELERAAMEFLRAHEMHHWMMAALGGH